MSGYVHCACRDCMETTIGEAVTFCEECVEAGCQENPKIGTCMLCDDLGRDKDGEPCDVCGVGAHECLREDAYGDPEPNPECPACNGPGMPLGGLGNLSHFRCRDCGIDFSQEAA